MKATARSLTLIAVFALLLAMPAIVGAATPPQPTYASANVDGNSGEWSPPSDFFADMYRAGKTDKAVEAKLYLRYACPATGTTGILYALVLTQPGVTIDVSKDQYIRFGTNGTQLANAASGDDGTAPDFAYITSGSDTVGWEASALVDVGAYTNLNIHAQVLHDGSQTSAVADRAIPLTLSCNTPTAISLSGLSATSAGNFPYAVPVAAFGIVTAGAILWRRRR